MSAMPETEDDIKYLVVVNDEKQYSIWRAERGVPAGWQAEGFEGTKKECLAHISDVWTDMRPSSLRRSMESADGCPLHHSAPTLDHKGNVSP
jgi:MbtH protein